MKVQAAVLWGLNEQWSVEEVELDGPSEGEVLVKLASSGLCHSDEHLVTGDIPIPFPVVGGHEGAGTVVEVGPNVSAVSSLSSPTVEGRRTERARSCSRYLSTCMSCSVVAGNERNAAASAGEPPR